MERGITTTRPQHLLWLVVMNVLWAVGYPVTATALHHGAAPSLIAVLRLGISFLLLSPFLWKIKRWSAKLIAFSAFMGVIGFALPIWLQIAGLSRTDPAIAAISVSLEPLLTIVAAALMTGSRIPWWQKTALAMAAVGSWILTGEPRPGHLGHLLGDAALIASILCFTLYNVYSPRLSKWVDAAPAAALTFGFGALASTAIWSLTGAPWPHSWSAPLLWSCAYLALGATGLAYVLWLLVVSQRSMTVTALFLYVQPLLGTLLSWLLGQSPLTLSLAVGGALVLAAMGLGQESAPRLPARGSR